MFFPIGDVPNPPGFKAWVTWALIAVNILVYTLITLPLSSVVVDPGDPMLREYLDVLVGRGLTSRDLDAVVQQISAYDLFLFSHGYKPGAPSVVDLFSAMFLHAGFMHLAGNMLFLWIYGDNVEHRLGRVGYLIVYLATGVLATLAFGAFAGRSMVPLVGASGAISGVLGLYFVLFPRNRVKVFIAFFPFIMNVVLVPARIVLGIYVIIDNLLPFVVGASSGGVAYGAHLGGFLGGFAVALAGEQMGWRLTSSEDAFRQRRKEVTRPDDAVTQLRRSIAAGDAETSLTVLATLSWDELAPLSIEEWVQLSHWLEEDGHTDVAAKLLRRRLGHASRPEQARLFLALGLLRLNQDEVPAAYQHFMTALDLDPDPTTEARVRNALAVIERR